MNQVSSQGLLKSILGFFARKPPETPTQPVSLRTQALDAWVRTDAYLQHETSDFGEVDPEQLARTLAKFENLVHYGSDRGQDQTAEKNVNSTMPYPKLQAVYQMIQDPKQDSYADLGPTISTSKRKRDINAVIDELSCLETEAKKRRVLPREDAEIGVGDDRSEPEVDVAMLTRKRSVSLHQGLQNHWTCVCQRCSGLSLLLSLPQRSKGTQMETCFEVFFGVDSPLANTLQEARITVKDLQNIESKGSFGAIPGVLPEFAHICRCITESLDQRNCLNLLFEDGLFKRLRPQPKTFCDSQLPRKVSLSALFKHQRGLRGGSSVLPLKGKRILAFTLATALLPFLETPWVQPSFDHSKIEFFRPFEDGELPDITKPFLAMEQIPIIFANKMGTRNIRPELERAKHMVHPNASVLALGILLCELHYCKPVESWQKDQETARNVNSDYYTSLDLLKDLEGDAGVDYYLAVKACLQWEYLPAGELTSFESASVQRLFYQKVIKRLESEIFKSWRLRSEDLENLDSRENELCWGVTGREFISRVTGNSKSSTESHANPVSASSQSPNLNTKSPSPHDFKVPVTIRKIPTRETSDFQSLSHFADASTKSLFLFDASHHMVSEQDAKLSETWMDNLLSSIYHHVDPFDTAVQSHIASSQNRTSRFEPVKIAILDCGFDPKNPLLIMEDQQLDPRIKGAKSFVHGSESANIQDEIGHGTHALGLLLKIAPCAEIYIAKIADQETLGHNSYDAITKAINHAVNDWNVDIISMSFGIREYHEPMKSAVSNALHNSTLVFAAASNDGGNHGRAFPAKYPSVFCMHSTDGNGNPSSFNPSADEKDVNFSLLGEHVRSHWPLGKKGHNDHVNIMSGTSVATPIAAGLAASILSFVRQQEQSLAAGCDLLGPWLKDVHSMDAVLKSMVRQRRGAGYDYITPHILLDKNSTRDHVYNKIRDIKNHMYD